MLSPADQDLIRCDPGLPGLATLLDEAAFLAHLRLANPVADLRDAKLRYLRYKPGTNCLASYVVNVAGESHFVYGKGWRTTDFAKLEKSQQRASTTLDAGLRRTCVAEKTLVTELFPDDAKLPSLRRLADPTYRERFLARHTSLRNIPPECRLIPLNYKPERRFAGCLATGEQRLAALKVYTESGFRAARCAARLLGDGASYCVAQCLGESERRRALVFQWREGTLLSGRLSGASPDLSCLREIGAGLAEVQRRSPEGLRHLPLNAVANDLFAQAQTISVLLPALAGRACALAQQLTEALGGVSPQYAVTHGDFYPKQVLLASGSVTFLDFDEAAIAHPLLDIGNFLAHLEADAMGGRFSEAFLRPAAILFTEAHSAASGQRPNRAIPLFTAVQLFAYLPNFFRSRELNWAAMTGRALERVDEFLHHGSRPRRAAFSGNPAGTPQCQTVSLTGPMSALGDARMPQLTLASDARFLDQRIRAALNGAARELDGRTLTEIRISRHKPGRRCLLEVTFAAEPSGTERPLALLGKITAKRLDEVTPELAQKLRNLGFDGRGDVAIPEPLGAILELHLQLQRKIAGITATEGLLQQSGAELAARCARAIHKLHRAPVCVPRAHTRRDELNVLRERLVRVGSDRSALNTRLSRVVDACETQARTSGDTTSVLIHRDYYPDQVLVEGERLWLVDLDLCAMGDPCLDHGNFLAHVTELSFRRFGRADALADREAAYRQAALASLGEHCHQRLEHYTTLSLARHIYISTQFPERQAFTEQFLELCEDRLAIARTDYGSNP